VEECLSPRTPVSVKEKEILGPSGYLDSHHRRTLVLILQEGSVLFLIPTR
jgi:hypothetical protein